VGERRGERPVRGPDLLGESGSFHRKLPRRFVPRLIGDDVGDDARRALVGYVADERFEIFAGVGRRERGVYGALFVFVDRSGHESAPRASRGKI
jgi:hypothetical protein